MKRAWSVSQIIFPIALAVYSILSWEQSAVKQGSADAYAVGRMNGECRVVQMQTARPKGVAPAYVGVPFVKANATCDALYSPTPR